MLQVITVVRASKGKARSQNDPVSRGKVRVYGFKRHGFFFIFMTTLGAG